MASTIPSRLLISSFFGVLEPLSFQQLKHQWADQTVLQKLLVGLRQGLVPAEHAKPNSKPSVLCGFIDTVASYRHVHLAGITWRRCSASSKSADF